MIEIRQTSVFAAWLHRLRDQRAKAIIAARVDRLAQGHAGDVAPVGNGLGELRIHHGAGYKIYFLKRGITIIILLCGGDKKTQNKAIKAAKQIASDLEE